MTLDEIEAVLRECAEFVEYFWSDRADSLLPRIAAARQALQDAEADAGWQACEDALRRQEER